MHNRILFALVFIVAFVSFLLHTGCPTTPNKEPVPTDGGSGPIAQTKPMDQPLGEDEVRAGQIKKDSDRITGHDAKSQVGDWKLYNGKVAFVIHGVGPARSWAGRGGHLIDASVVDKQGKASQDLLEEVTPIIDIMRVAKATEIKLIEPGGKGKKGIIRVKGTDVGIPPIDSVLRSKQFKVAYEIDYILHPKADYIEIVTRLADEIREDSLSLGDGLLLGDQGKIFGEKIGTEIEQIKGKPIRWFASFGKGASYLFVPADPKTNLSIPLTQAAIIPTFGLQKAPTEGVVEYKRHLYVGGGSVEKLFSALRTNLKASGGQKIQGKVSGTDAETQVQIMLFNKDKVLVSQTQPDSSGAFQFEVLAGDYKIEAKADGHPTLKQDTAAGKSVDLKFQPRATLQLEIKEKKTDGKITGFVPVRVQLSGPENKRIEYIYPDQKIYASPGKYKIMVSRGLEYEYVVKEQELSPNKTTKVSIEILHAVEPKGYVGADLHLHATPSIDSELSVESRISTVITEGLHFVPSTDHDTYTDYRPVIEKMKLTKWLTSVIGEEVSPFGYHFNTFPVQAEKTAPKYFAVNWAEYKEGAYQRMLNGPEVWAKIRKTYKAKIIQINHPRDDQAFLSLIKYDPKKGIKAVKKGLLDDNWDVIEIYNGGGREEFLKETLFDWFSFLNQGWYKTAAGNSDSHSAGSRPGMPRTLIASSTRDPSQLKIDEIVDSLKKGKAQVYAGPYIVAKSAKGEGPGARIKNTTLDLEVAIYAPSWIAVSYVKIYANGKLEKEIPVPAGKDVQRFKQVIRLKPSKDTWYVVMAGDDKKDMAPVYPGRLPLSMTNPIYLDIDGNGFTPPGIK